MKYQVAIGFSGRIKDYAALRESLLGIEAECLEENSAFSTEHVSNPQVGNYDKETHAIFLFEEATYAMAFQRAVVDKRLATKIYVDEIR